MVRVGFRVYHILMRLLRTALAAFTRYAACLAESASYPFYLSF